MKDKKTIKAIDDFLLNGKIEEEDNDRKKYVKDNNSIIERVDKIIIVENGKQLLREQY